MRAAGSLLALVMALGTGSTGQAAPSDDANPILRVRPVLCIANRQSDSCATVFQIDWRSPRPGNYCLGSDQRETPLRCWTAASTGAHRDQVVVTQDFHYWLAEPDSATRLRSVKVELLRLHGDDRRRDRRSRHVWDVL
jgi:hypothetical protein